MFYKKITDIFLMPFCSMIFVVSILSTFYNLKFYLLGNDFFIFTDIIFGFLTFFIWFKKLSFQSKIRRLIIDFLSPFFIICTFTLAVLYIFLLAKINLSLPTNIYNVLILTSIFSGFTIFFANKERIVNEISIEKKSEIDAEQEKDIYLANKFKITNKIPALNFIIKWFYKEGWTYSIFLIFIIIIFFGIKLPYLNLSFTGAHNMKYSAYIEPAKQMLENGLLWNQNKYQADPISLPNGKFETFGQYPIMEWGVVAINKLLPSNSIEFNTRIFMSILGITLLILIYSFLKKFFVRKQAILALYILSINVIFQFFTYVTVLDPINLIFLFWSLIIFVNGIREENVKKLFLSGIIAGIGISIKYHALIFYFPIYILILFFYKKISSEKKILYLLITLPNFLLQTIIFRISFRFFPTDFVLNFFIFAIIIFIQVYIYKKINFISLLLEKFLKGKTKFFYASIGFVTLIIVLLITKLDWVNSLLSDFITDEHLILNWNMYNTFFSRYKDWLTPFVYYPSILLILFPLIIKDTKIKLFIFSFTISSLVYLVIASKVLYFHEYYHHIIIISFILSFSFIYHITRLYTSLFLKILTSITFFIIIIIITYQSTNQVAVKLSAEKTEIMVVSEYVNKYLDESKFFIYSTDVYTSISFYSNRLSLLEELNNSYNIELVKKIKEDINNNIGFGDIMKKNNIYLYISKKSPESNNDDFSYLFMPKNSNSNLSGRTLLIICKENNLCENNSDTADETRYLIFKEKIKPHLNLVKKIGEHYIYTFI